MVRTFLAATAACALAGLSATAADAAHFAFDFTAPVQFCYENDAGASECYAGDTATGAGFFDADDNGDGSFSITSVTGKVFPWDGSDAWTIDFFQGGSFDPSVIPAIDLVDGAYQLDNLSIGFSSSYSSSFLMFFRSSGDGSLTGYAGDGGQITGATFTITPAAAVPEVATWGLMMMGFGAIGFAMRRRRAAVTFA